MYTSSHLNVCNHRAHRLVLLYFQVKSMGEFNMKYLWSMDLGVVPKTCPLSVKLNIHQNGRNQLMWWFLSHFTRFSHPYLILNLGTHNYDGQSLSFLIKSIYGFQFSSG